MDTAKKRQAKIAMYVYASGGNKEDQIPKALL